MSAHTDKLRDMADVIDSLAERPAALTVHGVAPSVARRIAEAGAAQGLTWEAAGSGGTEWIVGKHDGTTVPTVFLAYTRPAPPVEPLVAKGILEGLGVKQ